MQTTEEYAAGVRSKYNTNEEIWEPSDTWHAWSRQQIRKELAIVEKDFATRAGEPNLRVLDLGSGGECYFSHTGERVEVDLADRRLIGRPGAVCCSAERLALATDSVDLVICVGSVLNYCSLEEAVAEIARVARPDCVLTLHVELSNSWEFFGTRAWRRSVAFVESFYKGKERYWVYSDDFVRRTLERRGFRLQRASYFHFLSSLAYRLTGNAGLSSRLAPFDRLISWTPGHRAAADSVIYVCRLAA